MLEYDVNFFGVGATGFINFSEDYGFSLVTQRRGYLHEQDAVKIWWTKQDLMVCLLAHCLDGKGTWCFTYKVIEGGGTVLLTDDHFVVQDWMERYSDFHDFRGE